jgi:hypothetical protein
MSNFTELDFLPQYDLQSELEKLDLDWGQTNQICITTIPEDPDNYQFGVGSLYMNWKETQAGEITTTLKENPPTESDFTEIASIFKGTLFDDVIKELKKHYVVGRVRIMKSNPKSTLSWHWDDTIRLHYPMETHEGCFMVIGSEIKHLKQNTWYETNTIPKHTAFNGSFKHRTHLVVNIIKRIIPHHIAITGHTNGLGKLIYDNFDIDGFSRSTGHDVNDIDSIIDSVKDYKVFINNVATNQTEICKRLWELWKDDPSKKIINIGSRAKDFIKSEYGFNKHVLSEFTKHANFNGVCKVSCVNFGYINKLTENEILETISFVTSKDCVVEEITVFGKDDDTNN